MMFTDWGYREQLVSFWFSFISEGYSVPYLPPCPLLPSFFSPPGIRGTSRLLLLSPSPPEAMFCQGYYTSRPPNPLSSFPEILKNPPHFHCLQQQQVLWILLFIFLLIENLRFVVSRSPTNAKRVTFSMNGLRVLLFELTGF